MLDYVERLSDHRECDVSTFSVWMGSMPTREAFDIYLSADAPEHGAFALDLGETWFDHDFLEASFHPEPVSSSGLASVLHDHHGLTGVVADAVVHDFLARGLHAANAIVILRQHTFTEELESRSALAFVGTYESEESPPPVAIEDRHLFVGITTQPTLADLRAYVTGDDSGSATTLAAEIGSVVEGAELYGYRLRDENNTLLPKEFFALPIVTTRIALLDDEVLRRCAEMGIDRINAFISVPANAADRLAIHSSIRVAGLHYLGVVRTEIAAAG